MHPEELCMPKRKERKKKKESEVKEIHITFSIYIVHCNPPRNEDERQKNGTL